MATTPPPELWTCPHCGGAHVTRNTWHSCTRIELDDAFARSVPSVRKAYRFIVRSLADLDIDGLDTWRCESDRDLGMQQAARRRRVGARRRAGLAGAPPSTSELRPAR